MNPDEQMLDIFKQFFINFLRMSQTNEIDRIIFSTDKMMFWVRKYLMV